MGCRYVNDLNKCKRLKREGEGGGKGHLDQALIVELLLLGARIGLN